MINVIVTIFLPFFEVFIFKQYTHSLPRLIDSRLMHFLIFGFHFLFLCIYLLTLKIFFLHIQYLIIIFVVIFF